MKTVTKSRLALLSLMVLSAYGSNASAGGIAYGFSILGIDDLKVTSPNAVITHVGNDIFGASNTASINGVSDSRQVPASDAPQAWVGPHPTENWYGQNIPGLGGVQNIHVTPPYTNLSAGGPNGNDGSAFANFPVGSGPFTYPAAGYTPPTQGEANPPPNYTVAGLPANTPPVSLKDSADPANTALSQPLADFARGDSQITTVTGGDLFAPGTPGLSGINVAESYLASHGNSSGLGSLSLSTQFILSTDGDIQITGNFSDALYAWATGTASAHANYKVDFTLNDLTTGAQQKGWSPIELNHTRIAPANLQEHADSGHFDSFNLVDNNQGLGIGLIGGNLYQLDISMEEQVILRAAPEPASLSLFGAGLVGLFGFGKRRRSAK